MQKNALIYGCLMMLAISLSSCEVIGGIFKAGVWTGVIIVALIIGVIIWLATRGKKP